MRPERFRLGAHHPHWVAKDEIAAAGASLFISRTSLSRLKSFHQARVGWYQDSGGFTELQKHGDWTVSAEEYVAESRRFAEGMGMPGDIWPRDRMCEPWVIFGRPELPPTHPMWFHGTHEMRQTLPGSPDDNLDTAVAIHQRMTAEDGVLLPKLAPKLPFRKVLQGWTVEHYLRHADMYRYDYGVDLAAEPVVGLGSVCRRQATDEIGQIVTAIREKVPGIRLHGFGVKIDGIRKYGHLLHSADSQAWSAAARRRKLRLPSCTAHKNCANCPKWALMWRNDVLAAANEAEALYGPTYSGWRPAA